MRIDELLLKAEEPTFSFEFFPPRSEAGEVNLAAALTELHALAPTFVSVTYGAGGSTRDHTVEIVSELKRRYGLEAMAHLTCVNATVSELRSTLDVMRGAGVENVLALRGDPPRGQDRWTKTDGGLEYSRELIEFLRTDYPFAIGAAAFPETHIHATSPEDDLRFLKAKVDAGASFLITQMFFDNAYYFDFVARARDIGIDVPIIPGVMPILSAAGIKRMAELSAAKLPSRLEMELAVRRDDDEAVASSASPTPPCNASNCSNAARPASTSSHSIDLQLLARSSPRCALRAHGTGSRARFEADPALSPRATPRAVNAGARCQAKAAARRTVLLREVRVPSRMEWKRSRRGPSSLAAGMCWRRRTAVAGRPRISPASGDARLGAV
jgi:methylenetetrahydrofolate reductase (NADPH)